MAWTDTTPLPFSPRRRVRSCRILLALVLLGAASAEAVKRRAFVTSVSGTGDLGSWPDAGAATGLAAGNAICRARATAAGLPNANTYRAWLSSATTDAYCHLRGQSGAKFSCTGGAPLGAGPWYLVNGITNFTGTLDQLTSNNPQIYRPVLRDEFNDDLPLDPDERKYWTGTKPDGTVYDDAGSAWTCNDWTNGASGSSAAGDGLGTTWLWTIGGFLPGCDSLLRLLCFEPGASETSTLGWSPGNPVFVTSTSGSGNLASWPEAAGQSGLAAGDAICRSVATAAHLPDPASFVAWLSTSAVDARDRITANGPFRRIDHYTVAGDEADLIDGSLDTTIHVQENGLAVLGVPDVATGTLEDGTASGHDCLGWTSAAVSDSHTGGRVNFAGLPSWTNSSSQVGCNGVRRLYCLSNRTVIFWDGFDLTGSTGRWTSTTP